MINNDNTNDNTNHTQYAYVCVCMCIYIYIYIIIYIYIYIHIKCIVAPIAQLVKVVKTNYLLTNAMSINKYLLKSSRPARR